MNVHLYHLKTIITLLGLLVVLILGSCIAQADLVYNLRAELEDKYIYIENEKHYYDIFYISTPSYATVTFDNYAANLGSSNEDYDYNDPYLYLLTSFQQSVDNFIYEDDDGNEDVEEGLFFYLSDITFTNNLIALVTSYDPEVKGTADFTITSNNQLYIIPEPLAISLIATSGLTLLIIKRKFL
jgi:hypothetical protein